MTNSKIITPDRNLDRRKFIEKTSLGLGAITLGLSPSCLGDERKKHVNQNKKLGIALVGLGYYGRILGEALQETRNCYLSGIVTGTPAKEKEWQEKYNVKPGNTYNYQNFDDIAKNDEIDIIYVVLPNSMHKEFTIRAAQAGKHVICEKPMALNAQECREMIAACEKAGVKLSIGYRMHFEPTTQEIIRIGKEQVYGTIKFVGASAGYTHNNADHWKCKKNMGGGVMMDMGVYPLQAARYATGEEPVSVTAQTFVNRPEMFNEVDETTTFQLEFPSGAVANLHTSFYTSINYLHVAASEGWYSLNPFSSYRGIKGDSKNGPLNFPVINQQAAQMDEVAECIRQDKPMRVPGEEGLRDMIVVDAIYQSLASGKKIQLS